VQENSGVPCANSALEQRWHEPPDRSTCHSCWCLWLCGSCPPVAPPRQAVKIAGAPVPLQDTYNGDTYTELSNANADRERVISCQCEAAVTTQQASNRKADRHQAAQLARRRASGASAVSGVQRSCAYPRARTAARSIRGAIPSLSSSCSRCALTL
jgi:hypothetical protein